MDRRPLLVTIATLGIGLLGANASPSPAPPASVPQTITVLDSKDVNGGLSPLQIIYPSAAIAAGLTKAGVLASRIDKVVPSLAESGPYLCTDNKTDLLIQPSIMSVANGREQGIGDYNTVRMQLTTFDCATHAVKTVTGAANSGFDWISCANKSITDVVKRYLTGAPSAK